MIRVCREFVVFVVAVAVLAGGAAWAGRAMARESAYRRIHECECPTGGGK